MLRAKKVRFIEPQGRQGLSMKAAPDLKRLRDKNVQNKLGLSPLEREQIGRVLDRADEDAQRLRKLGAPPEPAYRAAFEFIRGILGPEQQAQLREILGNRPAPKAQLKSQPKGKPKVQSKGQPKAPPKAARRQDAKKQ